MEKGSPEEYNAETGFLNARRFQGKCRWKVNRRNNSVAASEYWEVERTTLTRGATRIAQQACRRLRCEQANGKPTNRTLLRP